MVFIGIEIKTVTFLLYEREVFFTQIYIFLSAYVQTPWNVHLNR